MKHIVSTERSLYNFKKKLQQESNDIDDFNQNLLSSEKVSQRLLDMAGLISKQYNYTVDRKLLDILVVTWNMAVVKKFDVGDSLVKKTMDKFLANDDMHQGFNQATEYFIHLKDTLYPEDLRMIHSYEIIEVGGQIKMNVASMATKSSRLKKDLNAKDLGVQ